MREPIAASKRSASQDNIGERLAQLANQTVAEFLSRGLDGIQGNSQLPLLRLLEVVQSRSTRMASRFLRRRYPWISETDVSLGCGNFANNSNLAKVGATLDHLTPIFELMEGSFDAISELSVKLSPSHISIYQDNSGAKHSNFHSALVHLEPYALHQLGKYLQWQLSTVDAESEAARDLKKKLHATEAAWQSRCSKLGISNDSSLPGVTLPWKGAFVATFFRMQCMSIRASSNEAIMPALALFLDNREMLESSGSIDILS